MADASLRIVCGPTAAGKSALALALAERTSALIVSADSRQIYCGFDVGTAKPTTAERRRVPHRGIDVVAPTERYSAARFAADAARWLGEAAAERRTPIVVGGTGFYLRALVTPLFDEPPLDEARRRALQAVLGALRDAELRRWCRALDPPRARLGRAQLLRAVEVALLSGRRLSDLHRTRARPARWAARYLLVDPGARLHERIAARVDAMLRAGWADEVRELARRVPPEAPAWNSTGYGVVRSLVEGALGPEEARERIIVETRQYAKRQRTWFRHQLPSEHVTRVDPEDGRCGEVVARWWDGESGR